MSWALDAIEREAMARAERSLSAIPRTFTWMGVSPERLTWLIREYEARTGLLARDLDPVHPISAGVA